MPIDTVDWYDKVIAWGFVAWVVYNMIVGAQSNKE